MRNIDQARSVEFVWINDVPKTRPERPGNSHRIWKSRHLRPLRLSLIAYSRADIVVDPQPKELAVFRSWRRHGRDELTVVISNETMLESAG